MSLKIKIISIGNSPSKSIQDILLKYTSRFDSHFKIELLEIKPEKKSKSIELKKLQEAQKIFQKNYQTGCKVPPKLLL